VYAAKVRKIPNTERPGRPGPVKKRFSQGIFSSLFFQKIVYVWCPFMRNGTSPSASFRVPVLAGLFAAIFFSQLNAQTPSSTTFPELSCTSSLQCSSTQFVYNSFYDTLNEVLYLCGDFNDASGNNRRKVAAIDLRTGSTLPWNPVINNGIVYSITKTGNTVYIAGTFTQVNSITRNYLAAINATTGALLAWNPNPNASVNSVYTDGTYLVAGGNFTSISGQPQNYLAVYTTSGNAFNTWQPNNANMAGKLNLNQALLYSNKIYFRSENPLGGNSVYAVPFSTTQVNSIMDASADTIYDIAISNNKLYCTGNFYSINSAPRTFCASWNIATSSLTAWNPALPNNGPCEYHVEIHNDTALIACHSFVSEDTNYHYIKKFTTTGSGSYIGTVKYYETNLYNPRGSYFGLLLCAKDKLVEVARKHFHGPYVRDSISVYCFRPNRPNSFTASSAMVCQGQNNVPYTLPAEPGFTSYSWSYSGSGASITGNTNAVTISFSPTATSGTLSVYGINLCGIAGPARMLSITVNPSPNANAGSDLLLTCTVQQVTLNGSSSTPSVTYSWSGPGNFSATYPNPPATGAGSYTLTVVNTATGCAQNDIMMIGVDTIRPVLNPLSGNYQLTCSNNSVLLDAGTLNASDSLRWTGPSNFSSADPAVAVLTGNYIITALDTSNGCTTSDTALVIQNVQLPNVSLSSTDDTLTCAVDSILLTGSSSSSNTTLLLTDINNDTLYPPYYVTQAGSYQLTATDTGNGCTASSVISIQQYTTPPQLSVSASSYNLNCSMSTVTLLAGSQTPNALLSWAGPNNFAAPDTAAITQTGTYVATALDPANGCTASDSISIGYQNTLLLTATPDTTICNGSGAVLTVSPVGGTPGFTYSWSTAGTSSAVSVMPTDTTSILVTVNDAAGCTGTDTITVFVPSPIADSTLAFQPCDSSSSGQIQLYPYGGLPPYQYSIDNGSTFQSSQVFTGLNYGTYNFIIRDSLGCTKNETSSITTGSSLPEPQFLVSTTMTTQDTFVIVDISNPRPDSVSWSFPPLCVVVDTDMFAPVIVNTDTGTFSITMNAYYGDCMLSLTKNINVQPYDTNAAGPFNNNGIQSVTLYPNPNSGQFSVDVQLYKKQTFAVFVYDASGVEHYRQTFTEAGQFSGTVNVQNPTPGPYVLKVIAEYDASSVPFIIQ
jgi:hypothetical protein